MKQETLDYLVQLLVWGICGAVLIGALVLYLTFSPLWAAIAAGAAFLICGLLGDRVSDFFHWLIENLWWFS